MKALLRIIPILAAAPFVLSQNESRGASAEISTSATTVRVLGEIPDGTPPPPELPKPEFQIPKQDILKTTTHDQGGRTITIRQIKPIALPPPTAPVARSVAEVDAEFSQRLAEYREDHPKSGLLVLSATVFRSNDSPPRTLVRCWPEGGGTTITFWSSADFALIAGGINSFVDSAANTHHLLMGWGNVEMDRMSDLRTTRKMEFDAPEMPDFAEGKASFQITGTAPDAEALVPIQALHDLYNSELARLTTAYQGRERARILHEAELKANPPRPKDITLNYWHTERPVSKEIGGAAR